MTLQLYVRYTLTDLCTLLSDNGRLLGVQLLLPASSWSTLLANIVGTASALRRFWAGIPKASRNRTPSVTKQSSLKCLEHKRELDEGPSQLLLCRLTALIHFLLRVSSFGNECKLHPIPLVVLHPAATQRLGIAKVSESLLIVVKCKCRGSYLYFSYNAWVRFRSTWCFMTSLP